MAAVADRGQAKKLEDAARHWAGGGVKDEAADDLAIMGAMPELVDAVQSAAQQTEFEVWEDNWPAVAMFMRLQTQWVSTVGGIVGLNYQSAQWLFTIEGVEKPRELLADLQVMEAAALGVMNSKD